MISITSVWCKIWNLGQSLISIFHASIPLIANILLQILRTKIKVFSLPTSENLQFSQNCFHIVKVSFARANLIFRAFLQCNTCTLYGLFCTPERPLVEVCNPIRHLDPLTFLFLKFDDNEQIVLLFLISYTTTSAALNLTY